MKFAFVQEHRRRWPVGVICRVLRVSRSGFYRWRGRKPSAHQVRQAQLLETIRIAHAENQELYGSPRIHRGLLIDGEIVSRNTVAKLMRQAKIRAKTRRKFVPRTTDSRHRRPVARNLLERDFTAEAPNRKWVADIVPTDQGLALPDGVLDCFSRKIVGWAMNDQMSADLVSDALKMALHQRQPGEDLIHHSDHGVQYASEDYQQLLARYGIVMSMSGRGKPPPDACLMGILNWPTVAELSRIES